MIASRSVGSRQSWLALVLMLALPACGADGPSERDLRALYRYVRHLGPAGKPQSYSQLAYFFLRAKAMQPQTAEMMSILREVLRRAPSFGHAQYLLANALMLMDRQQEVKALLEQMLEVEPDDPALLTTNGLAPNDADPRFHQQMVYAVASKVIESVRKARSLS